MAKKHVFMNGDAVVAMKWSGEKFLGIFENYYNDGSSCVLDVKENVKFNVKHGDIKLAKDEDEKEIKQLAKELNARKQQKKKKEETIDKEEMEEILVAIPEERNE